MNLAADLRDRAGKVILLFWCLATSILMSLLMAAHVAPFAASAPSSMTSEFIHGLTGAKEGWQMLHVVADGCKCSGDVVAHLIERGRDPRLNGEVVVLVGHRSDLAESLGRAGFAYVEMPASAVAAQLGVEAAPTLVIVDERGSIRYSGGYYARRERTVALDGDLLADVIAGREAKPLPLFGCAFSKRLQAAVDPLHLKYSRNDEGDVQP